MSVNFENFYNAYLNMFMQTGISEENMWDEGFFWSFFALFSIFIRKFATSILIKNENCDNTNSGRG